MEKVEASRRNTERILAAQVAEVEAKKTDMLHRDAQRAAAQAQQVLQPCYNCMHYCCALQRENSSCCLYYQSAVYLLMPGRISSWWAGYLRAARKEDLPWHVSTPVIMALFLQACPTTHMFVQDLVTTEFHRHLAKIGGKVVFQQVICCMMRWNCRSRPEVATSIMAPQAA